MTPPSYHGSRDPAYIPPAGPVLDRLIRLVPRLWRWRLRLAILMFVLATIGVVMTWLSAPSSWVMTTLITGSVAGVLSLLCKPIIKFVTRRINRLFPPQR